MQDRIRPVVRRGRLSTNGRSRLPPGSFLPYSFRLNSLTCRSVTILPGHGQALGFTRLTPKETEKVIVADHIAAGVTTMPGAAVAIMVGLARAARPTLVVP